MDDRLLDSVVFELYVPSIKKWNKHCELIQKFAKYSKKPKLRNVVYVNDENVLIEWFECMLCSDNINILNTHFIYFNYRRNNVPLGTFCFDRISHNLTYKHMIFKRKV